MKPHLKSMIAVLTIFLLWVAIAELWAPAPASNENIWQLLSKFNDSDRKMIQGLKEGDREDEMSSIIDNYKEQREQSERNLRLIHTPSLPSPDPNQSSQEGPCGMIPSPAPSPL
ncbi:hypothetical protein Nepgr_025261 [Nepenthes gracilis]|uniref:Uncharacterized protein n=1 Tax=Nepenthes gracilis TaxID=150966 RepID=A0AAD3T4E8_NEPGR|nr:hypothetical protein Nepgr_025261 [Nepenthes gracilis]